VTSVGGSCDVLHPQCSVLEQCSMLCIQCTFSVGLKRRSARCQGGGGVSKLVWLSSWSCRKGPELYCSERCSRFLKNFDK
jgi:hypothetical protein